MEFAIDAQSNQRVRASRDIQAVCPLCYSETVAKCGAIVVHHWAHRIKDCDPWSEPETEWHRYWKGLMPDSQTEVIRDGHRADIVRADGHVVELQHSKISVPTIECRETAYRKMTWLFDGRGLIEADLFILRQRHMHYSFRWKHPRKSYSACLQPVYIDLGYDNGIFRMKKLHLDGPPYGGWGYVSSHESFIAWLRQ